MELLSYGDRITPGIYTLHSAFENAVNFVREGKIATAVTPESAGGAGDGPLNMVFDTIEPLKTASGMAVTRESMACPAGIFSFASARGYVSALSLTGGGYGRITQAMPAIKKAFLAAAPETSLAVLLDPTRERYFTSSFDTGFLARAKAAFAAKNAAGFKGLGAGLTPAGDDFITGVLCGLSVAAAAGTPVNARRLELLNAAMGENALSNTFLRCAAEGWYFVRTKRLLEAAADEDCADIESLVRSAVKFGNTSGADTLAGLICYFEGRF